MMKEVFYLLASFTGDWQGFKKCIHSNETLRFLKVARVLTTLIIQCFYRWTSQLPACRFWQRHFRGLGKSQRTMSSSFVIKFSSLGGNIQWINLNSILFDPLQNFKTLRNMLLYGVRNIAAHEGGIGGTFFVFSKGHKTLTQSISNWNHNFIY